MHKIEIKKYKCEKIIFICKDKFSYIANNSFEKIYFLEDDNMIEFKWNNHCTTQCAGNTISKEYRTNGVSIEQRPETLRVQYNGLLANSGAPDLFLQVGFGDNWNGQQTVKMHKTGANVFEAEIPWHLRDSRVELCFKDNANNWDNYYGHNYRYEPEI